MRLPSRSPNLNAYAERFVRSIKHECLRHSLGNLIPFPSPNSVSPVGRIGRRERLGGLLSFYERNAA